MADIAIPSAWVNLSEEGLEGTVMIIGASDTGRSTLALHTALNLALSSGPGDAPFPLQGRQITFISSMRLVKL